MATTVEETFAPAIEHLRDDLAKIEEAVVTGYTLADAIREGSSVTTQEHGWGSGETACALSAGSIAATARGYSV
jgi:hypothetical protein